MTITSTSPWSAVVCLAPGPMWRGPQFACTGNPLAAYWNLHAFNFRRLTALFLST